MYLCRTSVDGFLQPQTVENPENFGQRVDTLQLLNFLKPSLLTLHTGKTIALNCKIR